MTSSHNITANKTTVMLGMEFTGGIWKT